MRKLAPVECNVIMMDFYHTHKCLEWSKTHGHPFLATMKRYLDTVPEYKPSSPKTDTQICAAWCAFASLSDIKKMWYAMKAYDDERQW